MVKGVCCVRSRIGDEVVISIAIEAMAKSMLCFADYEFFLSNKGTALWATLMDGRPDRSYFILSDVILPGLIGYMLIQA